MAVTAQQINSSILHGAHRDLITKVNAGSASLADIAGAQVDLEMKAVLRDVKNSVATRVGINARQLDLPTKAILLAIANV